MRYLQTLIVFGIIALALGGCARTPSEWRVTVTPLGPAESRPKQPPEELRRVKFERLPNEKSRAIVDGNPGPVFDAIECNFLFSPQNRCYGGQLYVPGGRIVYLGRNKDKWVVILDGKQGPVSDHLPVLRFTPDGRRCIYAVIVRGKQRVVIDGNPTREYEHVWEYGFAPDNRSFYIAQEKNKQFLVLDEQAGRRFDIVGSPVFSDDGKRVAYWAQEKEGDDEFLRCVIDRNVGPCYRASITEIAFSPNGKRVAYVVSNSVRAVGENEQKDFVVLDGVVGAEFKWVRELTFSPDSLHLAYVANGETVVLDGKIDRNSWPQIGHRCYDPSAYHNSIIFSPDSKRLAYLAASRVHERRGRTPDQEFVIVLDGQPQSTWRAVKRSFTPFGVFSPDSRHFAFVACGETPGKERVVLDGQPGPKFGLVNAQSIRFLSDGSLVYIALKNKTRYRVHHVRANQ